VFVVYIWTTCDAEIRDAHHSFKSFLVGRIREAEMAVLSSEFGGGEVSKALDARADCGKEGGVGGEGGEGVLAVIFWIAWDEKEVYAEKC
jgi:hypothetical protein